MPKTLTLLTSGTRGDVQPYLALGLGLQEAGYAVRIATHASFAAAAEGRGLPVMLLADNPSDLFAKPGGEHALRWRGNPIRNLRATLQFWRAARPLFTRLIDRAWQVCQGSDAIIIGLPTLWGQHIADALQVPCLRCLLQPLTPTGEFSSPLLPFTFSLGAAYNRLTHQLVEQAIWQSWRGAINRWRRETLHAGSAPWRARSDRLPTLYGFSSIVVPRPPDWSPNQFITGYWFLPSVEWTPSARLVHFLEAGSPPAYVGFGSLTLGQPLATLKIVTQALEATGLRAILAVSRDVAHASLPDFILPVTDVPHGWLFPHMAGIIQHGGAGTTGAALRSGTPTLGLPHAADQFFWSRRVAALGAGPEPIPLESLTVDKLVKALRQLTHDPGLRSNVQAMGQVIAKENGVASAVEIIRTLM